MAHPVLRRNRWTQLSRRLRAQWRAEGRPCHLCGKPIAPDEGMDVDHIQPVSRRPDLAYALHNLAPAHVRCNRRRRDAPLGTRPTPQPLPVCSRSGGTVVRWASRRWGGGTEPGDCLHEAAPCPADCEARCEVDRLDGIERRW